MENKFFSLDKKQKEKQGEIVPAFYSKHLQMSFSTVKDIDKDVIIPQKGGIVWMQSDKAFNAFDLVVFIATKFPIKHLYASTYSISRRTIDSIIALHDKGMIEQLTLLISESMIKRNPTTIDNLMAMKASRANLNVQFAWSHAKVNLIETHDDYFVLEGSGNWSENAHFEQYVLANDKEVFDYRMQLFTNTNLVKY